VQEIAKEFGVNEITIKRMIYSKKIKAIKFGNKWRIPEEEYERLRGEGSK
jgi:excisionase family DNA binding protein